MKYVFFVNMVINLFEIKNQQYDENYKNIGFDV
jgi:hypothetical protein